MYITQLCQVTYVCLCCFRNWQFIISFLPVERSMTIPWRLDYIDVPNMSPLRCWDDPITPWSMEARIWSVTCVGKSRASNDNDVGQGLEQKGLNPMRSDHCSVVIIGKQVSNSVYNYIFHYLPVYSLGSCGLQPDERSLKRVLPFQRNALALNDPRQSR